MSNKKLEWKDLDQFSKQYIETLLWASLDDETPMDQDHDQFDLSSEALEQIDHDCKLFQEKIDHLLPDNDLDLEQSAHDFFLTRNGHGAGFWDRGHDQKTEKILCELCDQFGESDPYIGDDKKIYLYQETRLSK